MLSTDNSRKRSPRHSLESLSKPLRLVLWSGRKNPKSRARRGEASGLNPAQARSTPRARGWTGAPRIHAVSAICQSDGNTRSWPSPTRAMPPPGPRGPQERRNPARSRYSESSSPPPCVDEPFAFFACTRGLGEDQSLGWWNPSPVEGQAMGAGGRLAAGCIRWHSAWLVPSLAEGVS